MAVLTLACGGAWADGGSLQAVYDQAQKAFDAGDWDHAVSGFEQVLAAMPAPSRSSAIVRARLACALLGEDRDDEGVDQATQAMAQLHAVGSGPDVELARADIVLGDALNGALAYDQAIQAFEQARGFAMGPDAADESFQASLGIVQAAMVIEPDLAATTADSLIADKASFAALTRDQQAGVYTLRARAALNLGDNESARRSIKKALDLAGGDDAHVSLSQMATRGDAALIYAKLHDDDLTHQYLALTGEGHLKSEEWHDGADTEPPVCGPSINPDDVAVVEFSIGDDGRTLDAAPVWASRPGPMGVEFARAVRTWRWRPDEVAKLPAFWRLALRIELRCIERPPPLPLSGPFVAATHAWLASQGADGDLDALGGSPSATMNSGQITDIKAAPALFRGVALAQRDSDRVVMGDRLDGLLRDHGAPADVRAYAVATASVRSSGGWKSAGTRSAEALQAMLPTFDAMENGARAAAWLRTDMAIDQEFAGDFQGARAPLEAVVALPSSALPADDPIRQVAILHLSILDKKIGNLSASQARLEAAGLTGAKCDLLDVQPVPTNMAVSSSDFPREAAKWNFEGWVDEAFDIAPDGSVRDVRTVIAYPPFIFDDATEKIISRFRYLPPTFNNTTLGCSGETQGVNYQLPGR